MGDTDFTVFTLALDERESLLEVLRSFELLMGDDVFGDFFAGLVSVSVLKGSLNVAGFAGLVLPDWPKEISLVKFLPADEEGNPFGIDDLGGGGGGGIPTSPL